MTYELSNGSFYSGLSPPADATPLGIWYPRAGTLGGCSRHNALITIGAHDSDWTNIATITNDSSWSAANMLTYFESIENNAYSPSSKTGHGFSGWLYTSLTSLSLVIEDPKLLSLIISAATASGKSFLSSILTTVTGLAKILTLDINAPGAASTPGLYQVPLAMKDNVRGGPRDLIMSTANATNADGSRKYWLDIKLNTLVRGRCARDSSQPS